MYISMCLRKIFAIKDDDHLTQNISSFSTWVALKRKHLPLSHLKGLSLKEEKSQSGKHAYIILTPLNPTFI